MDYSMKEQFETINQQMKAFVGIYQDAIRCYKISENEFWIWYTLIMIKGEHSQQDICSIWSLPKQTVNTIITHMVQKGLATLEVVSGTRNRKAIHLTEAGKKYGESIVMPISKAERGAFEKLPKEDRIAFVGAFGRYIAILREEINEATVKC